MIDHFALPIPSSLQTCAGLFVSFSDVSAHPKKTARETSPPRRHFSLACVV
jgi:hypothetical protein